MALVNRYGRMWARNPENIESLYTEHKKAPLLGVYVLYDGSMPVYVGKGYIKNRLDKHTKGQEKKVWDFFSWFEIRNENDCHDIEAILLKTLPYYLHLFNRQSAGFTAHNKIKKARENRPIAVDKPRAVKASLRKIKRH